MIDEVKDIVDNLSLTGESSSLVGSSGVDGSELVGHDLLVGTGADLVSVSGSVSSLAPSSVLGGTGEGINGIRDFLLPETQLIVAFTFLDLVDGVVLGLFVTDGEDE